MLRGDMMRFIFIRKSWLFFLFVAIVMGSLYYFSNDVVPTFQNSAEKDTNIVINMVTGEFTTTTSDGKKIEAYRWDPGTIVIPRDKDITLSIIGVNGEEHPFYIEGTDIKGTVKKGEETVIPLHFKEEGTYRLICDTHSHDGQQVPMIAYIVVD